MKALSRLVILLVIIGLTAWRGFLSDPVVMVLYRTKVVERGDIRAAVSSTGTLNPVQLVDVGTQVSGQVDHVYVRVNDRVKAGQPLADIDPSLILSQLKQDESSLETARNTFEQ